MENKYTQEDLDRVLDKLKQGPLGQRREWQWDRVNIAKNLHLSRTEEQNKAITEKRLKSIDYEKRTANTDWEKKVKNHDYKASSAKIDYKKRHIEHADAYKKSFDKRKKPIKAFKVEIEKRGGPIVSKVYVGTYPDGYTAANELNLYQADIANVLRPKSKSRVTKGYTFEYA